MDKTLLPLYEPTKDFFTRLAEIEEAGFIGKDEDSGWWMGAYESSDGGQGAVVYSIPLLDDPPVPSRLPTPPGAVLAYRADLIEWFFSEPGVIAHVQVTPQLVTLQPGGSFAFSAL